jgi:endonuclease YncB( thermonuclease family)
MMLLFKVASLVRRRIRGNFVGAIMPQRPVCGKRARTLQTARMLDLRAKDSRFRRMKSDGIMQHAARRAQSPAARHRLRCIFVPIVGALSLVAQANALHAAPCRFAPQGEGLVRDVLDARTFRLDDGREVRLAGIETPHDGDGAAALAALIAGREVTLHGDDDRPDRYGRQPAFAFVRGADAPVQSDLLARGAALVSAVLIEHDCAHALLAAEATARTARRGLWAGSSAIKNAENPGDILVGTGRFAVVEGRVVSVRLSGATFYVNFSRRPIEGFAVTISRRMIPSLEAAGLDPKSLQNKRIRVRGWVERRRGPRIEARHAGQIQVIATVD